MAIGNVDPDFPVGTNMDQFDVGLIGFGVTSPASPTGCMITIGDEQVALTGSGLTYDSAGHLTGGSVTAIQDLYQGAVNFNLSGFSISATSLQAWAAADDNASFDTALFSGADTLSGGPQDDLLRSYAGDDSISGDAGSDTLDGGLGNDTLNGGAGQDVITTGGGSDVIVIGRGESAVSQATADVITDWSSSATLAFAHGPTGAADYAETTAADFTSATTAANKLIASGAADVVVVSVGADVVVFADSGNDNGVADDAVILQGRGLDDISISNFALSPSPPPPPPPPPPAAPPITNVEPFRLPTSGAYTTTITSGKNGALSGTSGNDFLDGHGQYHSLSGGAGDDTYAVYSSADNISEKPNGAIDTALSYAKSYTLASNVENGVVMGTTPESLTGNSGNNDLTSNNAGSMLNGGAGNDILHAGTGADMLTGGSGADVFEFSKLPSTAGQVTDFKAGTDVLDLRGLFATIGYHGTNPLADGHLAFQNDGHGNTQVLFDADGSAGSHAATLVTTLDHITSTSLKAGVDWVFG